MDNADHDRRQSTERGDRDEFACSATEAGPIGNGSQYDAANRSGEHDEGGLDAGFVWRQRVVGCGPIGNSVTDPDGLCHRGAVFLAARRAYAREYETQSELPIVRATAPRLAE